MIRFNRCAVALFFALLLLAEIPGAARAQSCGGRGQSPCVDSVPTFCILFFCAYEDRESCAASAPRIDSNHRCQPLPDNRIPEPAAVDFMDGTTHVTAGYLASVDLTRVTPIVPNSSHPVTCQGGKTNLSSVVPNTGAVRTETWVDEPDYSPRLAVNGSFFRLESGNPWDMDCTTVYGYTVSNGTLVEPEEQIVAYNMGAPPENFSPGTLLFYGAGKSPAAQMKWYPFLDGQPRSVPTGVIAAISGIPLVKDGTLASQTGPESSTQHPRTAVGLTADNATLIVVTVNPGQDSGTTLSGLAAYMISKGVRNAINLDGGGSAQFYYMKTDGRTIVSLPSDTVRGADPAKRYYRPVANILGFE